MPDGIETCEMSARPEGIGTILTNMQQEVRALYEICCAWCGRRRRRRRRGIAICIITIARNWLLHLGLISTASWYSSSNKKKSEWGLWRLPYFYKVAISNYNTWESNYGEGCQLLSLLWRWHFVLAWITGDASNLSCQSRYQVHFVYSSMSSGIVTQSKFNSIMLSDVVAPKTKNSGLIQQLNLSFGEGNQKLQV